MKRELIKRVVATALDNGLIDKGKVNIFDRQDEVTDFIAAKMFEYMKFDIETKLKYYAEDMKEDLTEYGLNEEKIEDMQSRFMDTVKEIMDILEQ